MLRSSHRTTKTNGELLVHAISVPKEEERLTDLMRFSIVLKKSNVDSDALLNQSASGQLLHL